MLQFPARQGTPWSKVYEGCDVPLPGLDVPRIRVEDAAPTPQPGGRE
jgi:hypothetical protein